MADDAESQLVRALPEVLVLAGVGLVVGVLASGRSDPLGLALFAVGTLGLLAGVAIALGRRQRG